MTRDRALFRRFPRLDLPVHPLLDGPTPVRRLDDLEAVTGADAFFVKDDGRSAAPYGGNKPRKLEWLLGDAKARGSREVIAIGADGSNYCLATAVHGTRAGFDVTLVVAPQPATEGVRRTLRAGLGTGATYVASNNEGLLLLKLAVRVAQGAIRGRPPYPTWFGGSSPRGTLGFVEAALELVEQVDAGELPRPDVVVVPTGSTGSHAGLLVGFGLAGWDDVRVVGVRVTPAMMGNAKVVAQTAARATKLLRSHERDIPRGGVRAGDVEVREGFFGPGYGVVTPEATAAMERLAALGIPLDPTYSGKTMAAALADPSLRGKRVVFWNTHNAFPVDDLPQGQPERLPVMLRRRAFG